MCSYRSVTWRSGYAGTRQVIKGLTQKCRDYGVEILSGVEVIGYDVRAGQVSGVATNLGDISCDLEPCAISRYVGGKTFGSTNSHSPWV